jgi:hypothetical protein
LFGSRHYFVIRSRSYIDWGNPWHYNLQGCSESEFNAPGLRHQNYSIALFYMSIYLI